MSAIRWYIYDEARNVVGLVTAPDKSAAQTKAAVVTHGRHTAVQSVASADAAKGESVYKLTPVKTYNGRAGTQLKEPNHGPITPHRSVAMDVLCDGDDCERTVRLTGARRGSAGPHYCLLCRNKMLGAGVTP